MEDNWVIDASCEAPEGLFSFIPVEGTKENPVFVVGLNFISAVPPPCCKALWGVIHQGGQTLADAYYHAHETEIKKMEEALNAR